MSSIKYHYACNELNELVAIEDVDESYRDAHTFHCISCGAEMIAKLGKVNAHHFAHKIEQESCGTETYLHKLAKLILKQKFYSSAPFEISYSRHLVCAKANECQFYVDSECRSAIPETFDLKRFYDTCAEEKEVDGFIADLLLTDSTGKYQQPVLLEIVVTHKSTKEKRGSGLRIVEIGIKDEADIVALAYGPITESVAEFIGFVKESKQQIILENRSIQRFFLYRNGAAYVSNMDDFISCKNAHDKFQKHSVLELNIDGSYLAEISPYEYGYVKAMDLGFAIKNCLFCKYHRNGYEVGFGMDPIFCCLYKKYGTPENPKPNEAMLCSYYKEDKARIDQIRASMNSVNISSVITY